MTYATLDDVEKWLGREFEQAEEARCETLLEGAAAIIDSYGNTASTDAKKYVSCQMVARVMNTEPIGGGVPTGATQGSMSALGYSQSWTMGGGGSGELYLSKAEKRMLGIGNAIGSRSPVQDLVPEVKA